MSIIIDAFWFFLPAGVANMAPVFVSRLPGLRNWKSPLDFGKSYKNERLLGDSKTWRGLLLGMLAAGLVGLVQFKIIVPAEASWFTAFSTSALMGMGALVGDAVESFFKRRRGIPPGQTWFPFDQIDYIIGGLIFVAPISQLSLKLVLTILVLFSCLHLATVYIGYVIGLRAKPI